MHESPFPNVCERCGGDLGYPYVIEGRTRVCKACHKKTCPVCGNRVADGAKHGDDILNVEKGGR